MDELDREEAPKCPICKSENVHIPGSMLCDKIILEKKFEKITEAYEKEKDENRRLREQVAQLRGE